MDSELWQTILEMQTRVGRSPGTKTKRETRASEGADGLLFTRTVDLVFVEEANTLVPCCCLLRRRSWRTRKKPWRERPT